MLDSLDRAPMKGSLVIIIVISLALISCSGAPRETDNSITVWAAMDKDEIGALAEIAARFEKETGTAVTITEIGLFEITTKLELAAPAGKGPDVVSIAHTSTGTLTLMGLLSPLDALAESVSRYPQGLVGGFRYRGSLWGIPLTVQSYGLVVNRHLVPDPPRTWEELFSRARKLTRDEDGDGTPDTYGFLTDPTNFYFTFPFYDACGAYIFKDRGKAGTDPTDLGFCTPGGIRALTLLTGLVGKGRLIPRGITYPIITDLFLRGRLAMTIYGTYLIPSWEALGIPVGYYELPPFADGRRGRPLATLMGLSVSAYANNKEGAQKFLTFLLLPENLRRFFERSGARTVMADPSVYRDEDFVKTPYLATALTIARDAYPFPNDPEGDLIWDAVTDASSLAEAGAESPERTLCDMQQRLGVVIEEMRR
jgi:maltose-binding protein MalE